MFGSGTTRQDFAAAREESTQDLPPPAPRPLPAPSHAFARLTPGLAETVLQYKLAHREDPRTTRHTTLCLCTKLTKLCGLKPLSMWLRIQLVQHSDT